MGGNSRLFYFILMGLVLLGASCSQRRSVRNLTAKIVDFGMYEVQIGDSKTKAVNTAYGELKAIQDNETLIEQTTNIPAQVGVSFGFRFMPLGAPAGVELPLVFRCLHPEMQNPKRGEPSKEDVFQWRCKMGERWRFMYDIEEEWEAVLGEWTLQVWHEGRMLTRKTFMLRTSGEHRGRTLN